MRKDRLAQLFNMDLRWDGDSYVGMNDFNKGVNFHYTEILGDSEEVWNEKIRKAHEELKNRKK